MDRKFKNSVAVAQKPNSISVGNQSQAADYK
jgi:hypothetical protein